MATFGQRLREYREANDLRQEDIANMLGTVKQVISAMENGRQIPKIDTLGDLADKLGVNPLWLMGRDVSMLPDTASDTITLLEYTPTKRAIISSVGKLSDEDAEAIKQLLGRLSNGRDQ